MLRTSLLAASAALLCTSATAQQRLDPSRMYPIQTPVKNAGTVDVTTGKWTKPGQSVKNGSQTVFNNTCSWTISAYYGGFDWCEENYTSGRIPSPSDPNAPPGAQLNNNITSVQVSYCTYTGPLGAAGYDMDLAFFDNLGGNCNGAIPPTPIAGGIAAHPNLSAGGYIALGGLGLPGSTAVGFQACWLITLDTSNAGLTIIGDSDGIYDGTDLGDSFTWMQRQNTTVGALQLTTPDGFFIAGEPATGGFGACSYNIPCGIDAFTGLTCGTGLDAWDGSWINVDGIGVGASNQPPGCVNSVAQYGFGTNCYFFGGYPTNPFSSYHLVLKSDGRDPGGIVYCPQSKATTVAGCSAVLNVTDTTLATGVWQATNIPRAAGLGTGTVLGIYIYTNGVGTGQSAFSANVAFGTLCLAGFKRSSPACAPATLPGAQAGVCNTGFLSTAINCNGGALGITVGQDVNVQLWYRDPGAVGDANFSTGLFYTVQ